MQLYCHEFYLIFLGTAHWLVHTRRALKNNWWWNRSIYFSIYILHLCSEGAYQKAPCTKKPKRQILLSKKEAVKDNVGFWVLHCTIMPESGAAWFPIYEHKSSILSQHSNWHVGTNNAPEFYLPSHKVSNIASFTGKNCIF